MSTIVSEGQNRKGAAFETLLNVGSGFIISYLMWMFVVSPIFDIPTGAAQSFGITAIFTVTSVIRSYFWRRLFNNNK